MAICDFCGKFVTSITTFREEGKEKKMCDSCDRKRREEKIEERLASIKHSQDFGDWQGRDLSEAFWLHLGKYKRCPNEKSLNILYLARCWAGHSDHGLSNSFSHALKWCGIDLFNEMLRKDLPKDYIEKGENDG